MAGEWSSIRLGEVCTKIGSGATPRGGSDVYLGKGPYSLIRSQNIYNNQFHHDGLAFIGEKHAAELENVEVLEGDVLLNITGDSVARVCQVDPSVLPARVNQHVAIIRPDPEKLDARFLRYHLVSPEIQEKLLSWAGSGGTRNALTKGMIELLDVRAPRDVTEQRCIAHILGTLDDKIELNRKTNETLEAIARALFKSWFVDFDPVRAKAEGRDTGLPKEIADLFPDRLVDSEMGEIPEGWTVKPLMEICTPGRGASPRPINDYMDGEVPWIKIADATAAGGPFLFETKERLKNAGVDKSVRVEPGDLILSNSATCGVPIFVELHGCIHDGWLYFKKLRHISKIYFFHILTELAAHLIHIADGSVQKNLNTALIGQQNILIPPKAILDIFDVQATIVFSKMRQNGLESRTLTSLRDTLLPKLISGDIRVSLINRNNHNISQDNNGG